MLQEVFNLDEGPVTLTFPSNLSSDSYQEMKDTLELALRRAQRRASLRARHDDPEYRARREAEIITPSKYGGRRRWGRRLRRPSRITAKKDHT